MAQSVSSKFLILLSLISLSCSAQVYAIGKKQYQARVSDLLPVETYFVESTNGLRLRDFPDTLGSEELTIIPFGEVFHPYYCQDIKGTVWAFGVYTDKEGTNWLGYVAARYLSGGCE